MIFTETVEQQSQTKEKGLCTSNEVLEVEDDIDDGELDTSQEDPDFDFEAALAASQDNEDDAVYTDCSK